MNKIKTFGSSILMFTIIIAALVSTSLCLISISSVSDYVLLIRIIALFSGISLICVCIIYFLFVSLYNKHKEKSLEDLRKECLRAQKAKIEYYNKEKELGKVVLKYLKENEYGKQ